MYCYWNWEAVEISALFFKTCIYYLTQDFLDSCPSVQLRSQSRFWVNFVLWNFGLPSCGTVYLGISCLNLQPVYMTWIFISVFQYNNILSVWTVSLEFIQTKEQLVKNWILNTEFHPLRAFSFYPWCCLVLSDSWFFFSDRICNCYWQDNS